MQVELLSEVMGIHIYRRKKVAQTSVIRYEFDDIGERRDSSINIYELMHLCKEWAYTKNYFLFSGYGAVSASCEVNHRTASLGKINPQEIVLADTEPEACFLACQWILENKDK
jgi:hypothetical protein